MMNKVVLTLTILVSIPFKREGISEPDAEIAKLRKEMESFNSLQTGRHFRTGESSALEHPCRKFQFPSNGKAFPNQYEKMVTHPFVRFNSLQTGRHFRTPNLNRCSYTAYQVSIPFKREGISELTNL